MLIVLISAKGSPGVTTAAVALAATTPSQVRSVVVEADPSGGDLGAAFALPAEPGLVGLASAARRDHRPGLVWEHIQELPGGLAVVPAPARPEQAAAALDVLLSSPDLTALQDDTTAGQAQPDGQPGAAQAVWVDAGRLPVRLMRAEAVTRLFAHADVVLLVVANSSAGIVHAASRLGPISAAMERAGQKTSPGNTDQTLRGERAAGVLLVGSNGYPAGEVALALGVAVVGVLPWDPRAAAVLAGRPARRARNLERLPLLRAAAGISARMLHEPTATLERQAGAQEQQVTGEHGAAVTEPADRTSSARRDSGRPAGPGEGGPFGPLPGVVPAGVSGAAPNGRRRSRDERPQEHG